MNRFLLLTTIFVGSTQLAMLSYAAPLDALLSATQSRLPGTVEIEASYDFVNDTVDIFNIRDGSDFAGTNVGDYNGGHVRLGAALTPNIWIDGALWKRKIENRQDQAEIDSWQIGTQYKFLDASGLRPDMAIRVGTWGNSSSAFNKTSRSQFLGYTLDKVSVDSPKDRQYQVDLIASWPIQNSFEVTTFAGVGSSRVSVGTITGSRTENGCNYNAAFEQNEVVLTLAQPCGGRLFETVVRSNSALGFNVYDETQYKAHYVHAGLSGKWTSGPWKLGAGYQYQTIKRRNVDDIIEQRGGRAYQSNHTLIGEVVYAITKNIAIFGRGQVMSNQFTGEIPFAYNSITASRFDKKYGLVSTGVVLSF